MVLKSKGRMVLITIAGLLAIWVILTLLAQREGPPKIETIGQENYGQKALIVYNPDLFYNLDEQICMAFAKGLSENHWTVSVATVAAAKELTAEPFNLYVFCANTYNWAPDRPVSKLIKNSMGLDDKNVVAITLGSGSTAQARDVLENIITKQGGNLISSKQYWLMRPNDETSDKSNVEMATEMARKHGKEIAIGLKQ